MSVDYQYYNDGRVSYSHDLIDNRFDRSYTYDHEARITQALSGAEARGQGPTNDRPYNETLGYDTFEHLTYHGTQHWSSRRGYVSSGSFSNNRRTGWSYDADGNLTNDVTHQYTYDVAGQMTFVGVSNLGQYFDGDGQRVKSTEPNVVTYYVRSTVLGGKVIADLDSSGNKQMAYIYLGDKLLAEQSRNVPNGFIGFVHRDASGVSVRKTHSVYGNVYDGSELDPLNADVGTEDPYLTNPDYSGRGEGGPLFPGYGSPTDPGTGCTLDGVYVPCDMAYRVLDQGAAVIGPQNTTRYNYTKQSFEFFRAYADGYYGFVLSGAAYMGNGYFIAPGGWDNEDELLESESNNSLLHHSPQHIRPDPCVEAVVNATFRSIRDAARESVPLLLGNAGTAGLTREQAAYVLASAMGESQMGNQMTEGWGPTAQQKKYEPPSAKATQLGNTQKGDGYLFRGRGYVQITGRSNYQYWGNRLGIDVVGNPNLALVPANAAQIAVYGMQEGTFTGQGLSDYINDRETNFIGARAIVNGSDRADTFAGYADTFLRALDQCGWHPVAPVSIR